MATKSKYPSPETLKKQINVYFDELGDNEFPDYAGMLLELDLFPDEVSDLCSGDDAASKRYRRVFEYAELKRESWLSRLAAKDSKLASGAFNLLKQGKNGGYTSASNTNKDTKVHLIVDKIGGMEAFK